MLIVFVVCCAILSGAATTSAATELWFQGVDPVAARDRGRTTPVDYMALFRPNARWATVAGAINAFGISTQFARRSTDEELAQVVNELRRRRIPMLLGAEISRVHDGCGAGVNGYTGPETMNAAASRLRRFGANVRYVAMDEPLWYGRNYTGPNACRDSVQEISRQVALGVADLRRWYPNVQIGDIEPLSFATLKVPGWLDQLREWMSAYRSATGTPLGFIDVDLVWTANWAPSMEAVRSVLHSRGLRFGVMFDGDADDQTDLAWTNHALSRYRMVMANPRLIPDDVFVTSWHTCPTRFLPEDRPGTLTNVVLQILGR